MNFVQWVRQPYNILFCIGLALVGIRFVELGITPFVADEPVFWAMADDAVRNRAIPLIGTSASSLPVPFGAGAVWIFMLPMAISNFPLFITWFHSLIFCLGFFFLFKAVSITYGRKAAIWSLALAASSPFLFFFSRHAWDTTFFVPISGAVLYIFAKLDHANRENRAINLYKYIAALTLLAALCVNIQLNSGHFVLTAALISIYYIFSTKRELSERLKTLGLAIVLGLLLCLPYMIAAYAKMQAGMDFEREVPEKWGDGRHLWWNLQFIVINLSVWQGTIFLDPQQDKYLEYVGKFIAFFFKKDLFGWIPKFTVWFVMLYPLILLARKQISSVRLIHILGSTGFIIALLAFQYLNVPIRPHYFQSFWWLPLVGIAFAVANFAGWYQKAFFAFLSLTLLVNTTLITTSLAFLVENNGTRGMYHGTGIMEVRRITKEFCAKVKINNSPENSCIDTVQVYTVSNPIKYFIKREEECKGLNVNAFNNMPSCQYYLTYDKSSNTDATLYLNHR